MAPAATVDHRALDGVSYRLESELDLQMPFTSVADLVVGGHRVEFTAGDAALGCDITASLGITEFGSEFAFQGGTLRTVTRSTYDPRTRSVGTSVLVVWTGKRYSLVTRLYQATEQEVLGLLRTLHIAEHADGLALTPDPDAGSSFSGPASVIKEVPGLGVVEMSGPAEEDTAPLPSRRGVSVPAGKLHRDTFSDGRPYFVLSGPSVRATVVPLPETAIDRIPEIVDGISLSRAV